MREFTVSVLVPSFANTQTDIYDLVLDLINQTIADFNIIFVIEKDSFGFDFKSFVSSVFAEHSPSFCFSLIELTGQLGIGFALKTGVEASNSDIIIRADVGDRINKDRIEHILDAFEKSPTMPGVVYSQAFLCSPKSTYVSKYPNNTNDLKKSFRYRNPICHPTVAFNRELILQFGSYNNKLKFCEDLDLWLRLLQHNVEFKCIDRPLVYYKLPSGSRTISNWKSNLLVRLRNFGSPTYLSSIIGIFFLASYIVLPKRIKDYIYAIKS